MQKNPIRFLSAHSFRVPYCKPFWNRNTYLSLTKNLCRGHIAHGDDKDRLGEVLKALFGIEQVVPCGNGRTALELALGGLAVSQGDEVVIPSLCCKSIVGPILELKATPVFADVGSELNVTPATVERAITARTRAVVVPHLFGNPADIDGVIEVCSPRGIAIIDDAAQALGARLSGGLVGSFGDAGIISFGKGKVCFGIGGGALLTRNEGRANAARIALNGERLGRLETVDRALQTVLWRAWRRWTLPAKAVLARMRRSAPDVERYRRLPASNLEAGVAMSLLGTLQVNLESRRQRVSLYRDLLSGQINLRVYPHRPGSACLTQVVLVEPGIPGGQAADALVKKLRSHGYEVGKSYAPLHLSPENRDFPRGGRLTETETVRDKLVELPCEPSVTMSDVKRICELMTQPLSA